jgi:hypothetical protein
VLNIGSRDTTRTARYDARLYPYYLARRVAPRGILRRLARIALDDLAVVHVRTEGAFNGFWIGQERIAVDDGRLMIRWRRSLRNTPVVSTSRFPMA